MISPSFATCPTCGQRMLMRHGVRLSPLLADLFDMIERSGKRGVYPEVLAGVFYPGAPTKPALRRIYTNVHYINALLAETDISVRTTRMQPYRVRRSKGAWDDGRQAI